MIKDGGARPISDVLGWNYTTKINDTCYSYYAAQPPLEGLTQPVVIQCPVGIQEITEYNARAEQAIGIVMSMDCGSTVAEMSLSWPMVPDSQPTWHIVTDIGCQISIGANGGKAQVLSQPA